MDDKSKRHLDIMNFKSPEEAYKKVKELASNLSDGEHLIRSCIFDFHAAVEFELKRIFYHTFKSHLFLTKDEKKNDVVLAKFNRMIEKLSFMNVYRVLEPALQSWPYPDLQAIPAINETRNAAAHGKNISEIKYKDRSPFKDADCFAQMFLDVWAIQDALYKYFECVIELPKERLKRYVKKYGTGEL